MKYMVAFRTGPIFYFSDGSLCREGTSIFHTQGFCLKTYSFVRNSRHNAARTKVKGGGFSNNIDNSNCIVSGFDCGMNFFDFVDCGAGNGSSTENTGYLDNHKFHLERSLNDWDANDISSANYPPRKNDFATTNNNNNQGENMDNFFRANRETKQKTISIPKSHNFLNHGDPNTSDISFREDQQQQFNHYSTPQQHRKQRHQHEVSLPVSSQNDLGETNNNPRFSSTQQSQHLSQLNDPRHDRFPSQPQRLKSPMNLNKHNEKIRDENHRSMSPLEQHHSVDMMMAKELNQMSFRERNEINEEIHGVSTLYTVEETPELICQSLEQLQFEFNHNVPMHSKMAYERSQQIYKENLQIREQQQQQNQPCSVSSSSVWSSINKISNPKGYVNDTDFLLLFLRRDKFDVRKVALRLANFMELVYELWGEKALTEKTWQSQTYLDPFEREVLLTGTMQVLSGRDRAGRRILGNFPFDNPRLTLENRVSFVLCRYPKQCTATGRIIPQENFNRLRLTIYTPPF
jgi:hypothetical protein